MEIERRWLIDLGLASVISSNSNNYKDMVQYYIVSSKECSVRIRKEIQFVPNFSEKCFLTIKSGSGLSRDEIETEIEKKTFNELVSSAKYNIKKRRSFISLDGIYIAELDKFMGDLEGHFQIEVEFPNEDEANNFNVPNWFGKEVTNDSRYLNAVLAENGLPKTLYPTLNKDK